MSLCRTVVLAGVLGLASVANAAAQVSAPCMNDIGPLRDEAGRRAQAIKAGIDHKIPRNELCHLFTQFAAAEAKFVKYLDQNQTWCGVPAQAVAQIKSNHLRTVKTKTQVCSGGPGPGQAGPPPGPGLSDALGTNRPPSASTTAPGRGTLDTLTGNPVR